MEKIKPRKKHLKTKNPIADLVLDIIIDSAWPILKNLTSQLSDELKQLSKSQKNPRKEKE